MINWDEFEHIHVIKKLKLIMGAWWSCDVIFSDDSGKIQLQKHDSENFANPASFFLLQKEDARKEIEEKLGNTLSDLKISGNRFLISRWDSSGYDIATFPIIIDHDYVGCVSAIGFLKDPSEFHRLQEVRDRLQNYGLNNERLETGVKLVKCIDDNQKDHFVDLMELLSQEVVTLHTEIISRELRIRELNKELGSRYKYDNMIGKSSPMQTLYALLDKLKPSETTVLIHGENGTGKELIAKAIHYNSPRKDNPFVIQNCSAFNDNLLESELFGHVKGAFTGAVRDKKGLFEMAHNGTFFLDEIGDTSPTMQVKLLRVLQEGTFLPVGAIEPKRVSVRILAATNKDLKKMVQDGSFREDLYYRLNVIQIKVPSLRDRKEDIPLLAEYFLNRNVDESDKKRILTKRALEKLYDYQWPGNVRELQNEIERALVLSSDNSKITADMLSPKIIESTSKIQGTRINGNLKEAIVDLEKTMIKEGLRRTGWNKSKLAKELGISRAGLIMKVEKYELDKRSQMKKAS